MKKKLSSLLLPDVVVLDQRKVGAQFTQKITELQSIGYRKVSTEVMKPIPNGPYFHNLVNTYHLDDKCYKWGRLMPDYPGQLIYQQLKGNYAPHIKPLIADKIGEVIEGIVNHSNGEMTQIASYMRKMAGALERAAALVDTHQTLMTDKKKEQYKFALKLK